MAKSTTPTDYINSDLTGNSLKIGKNDKNYFEKDQYWDPSRLPVCRTLALDSYRELCELPHVKAAPCGKNNAANIYVSLKKLFIFLRGLKKYGDKYINGTIKAVSNLQSEIRATISEIAGVLKGITQRSREWVLRKIKAGIDDLIYLTNPPQTKETTKSKLAITLDKVFCKFDAIIDGLFSAHFGALPNGRENYVITSKRISWANPICKSC